MFTVPMEAFMKDTGCFFAYHIGHYRGNGNQPYKNTWNDIYNFPDGSWTDIYFTPPEKKGELYFMIDTYTYQMVPRLSACN